MRKQRRKRGRLYAEWVFKFVPPDARFLELKNLARGLNRLEGIGYSDEQVQRSLRTASIAVKRFHAAREKERRHAWEAAREIVTECLKRTPREPIPARAVRRFNALAREEPFLYFVRSREETLVNKDAEFTGGWKRFQVPRTEKNMWSGHNRIGEFGVLTSGSSRSDVVHFLREFLVSPYRNRLKQCPVCRKWFVDASRNETSLRCGVKCTNRWWNRTRRKEAGHNANRRDPRTGYDTRVMVGKKRKQR